MFARSSWGRLCLESRGERLIHVRTAAGTDEWLFSLNRIRRYYGEQRYFAFSSSSQQLLRSLNIAIVGSGPSGCYTAKYLQSALLKSGMSGIQIDIIERLPTPYGLVRFGVAPDHPEVKNVQNDFDKLFMTLTTDTDEKEVEDGHPDSSKQVRIRLLANVRVGQHVSVHELRQLYDIVVLAYGCDSDRKLNLPGGPESTLVTTGVLSAREFVAWYNGHPDFGHIGQHVAKAFHLGGASVDSNNEPLSVVVIGQGNVALDCARILAKGHKGLYDTDITTSALELIEQISPRLSAISIIGRRGHVQGAFTIKELRELVTLDEEGYPARLVVRADELDLGLTPASQQELAESRPRQRMDKLLRDASTATTTSSVSSSPSSSLSSRCLVQLRFLLNPIRLEADPSDPTRLARVVCERTRLEGEAGQQKAVGTGEIETIPAQLALVSIGYKGVALPGLEPWFDEQRGILKNERGRVDGPSSTLGAGLYTSGWLKRGPSGIIGTNIGDAKDTVNTIMNDLESIVQCKNEQTAGGVVDLKALLASRHVQVVDWEGYQQIDAKERSTKRSEKQPREKIADLQQLIKVAVTK